MENYHVIDLVGEGSFGKVCLVNIIHQLHCPVLSDTIGALLLLIGCKAQRAVPCP